MEPIVTAVLTNEEGWQKRQRLSEGIHLVGTAPGSAIRLPEGQSIAPYHVQIVNNEKEAHVRLVNLSGREMILESGAEETMFAPRTMQDLFGGEILYLGPYKLQFEIQKQYIPKVVEQEQNQTVVGLRLVLSSRVLQPDSVIHGTLYLRNLGGEPCQFDVELDGLPPECYEIDPPPLINPGGEESSGIRIYHRGTAPAAGETLIALRVSAPGVYPGRELALRQSIRVHPCYRFLADWDGAETRPQPAPQPEPEPEPEPPAPVAAPQPLAKAEEAAPEAALPAPIELPAPTEPPDPPEPLDPFDSLDSFDTLDTVEPAPPAPAVEEQPALAAPPRPQKRPDLSGVKVVRVSSGDFLDEKGKQP